MKKDLCFPTSQAGSLRIECTVNHVVDAGCDIKTIFFRMEKKNSGSRQKGEKFQRDRFLHSHPGACASREKEQAAGTLGHCLLERD